MTAIPSATSVPTATSKYAAHQIDYSTTETPVPWRRDLRAVTWAELVDFLEQDHTNWNPHVNDDYVCAQFAADLADNALANNIKSGVVWVDYWGENDMHVFVWVDTSDKGRVWVEPQTDTPYVVPDYESRQVENFGVRFLYSRDTARVDAFSGWSWSDLLMSAEESKSDYYLNCAPGGWYCSWKPRVGDTPTPTPTAR